MSGPGAWVDGSNIALLTDLYELTMIEAYLAEGLDEEAVFSLFVRRLPQRRNYLAACGLDDALSLLEGLRVASRAAAPVVRDESRFADFAAPESREHPGGRAGGAQPPSGAGRGARTCRSALPGGGEPEARCLARRHRRGASSARVALRGAGSSETSKGRCGGGMVGSSPTWRRMRMLLCRRRRGHATHDPGIAAHASREIDFRDGRVVSE